jgi:hypothetical protein
MAAFSTIAALAAAAATVGGTVASAVSKPKAPKPRSLATEATESLDAQERNLAQQQRVDRAQLFNSLGLQNEALFGGTSPGTKLWLDKDGQPLDPEWQTYLNDPLTTEAERANYSKQYGFTSTAQVGAGQPGILDTYNRLLTGYAPQFAEGIAGIDPAGTAASDALLQQAMQEAQAGGSYIDNRLVNDALAQLDYGSQLDPVDLRALQQGVRSAQAARGMGYGIGDAGTEALAQLAGGQALRNQRQNYALNAAGNARASRGQAQNFATGAAANRFNTRTAPALSMLGMTGASNYAGNLQQGSAFNPLNAYVSDLNNTNYNAEAAAQIARYNGQQQAIGGLTSGLGNIAMSSLYSSALKPATTQAAPFTGAGSLAYGAGPTTLPRIGYSLFGN